MTSVTAATGSSGDVGVSHVECDVSCVQGGLRDLSSGCVNILLSGLVLMMLLPLLMLPRLLPQLLLMILEIVGIACDCLVALSCIDLLLLCCGATRRQMALRRYTSPVRRVNWRWFAS